VATSIRETTGRRLHRFSWINEWKERADARGVPLGLELILPDWFFAGVLDEALVLTIDPAYFKLTGGIERWLYRLVRKHGGKQRDGWQFDFPYLYRKSGSLAQPRASRCPATCCPSSAGRAHRRFWPFAPCRPRHVDNCGDENGTSCEWARAIRRAATRAIRRANRR
jgi:hypothetical protein